MKAPSYLQVEIDGQRHQDLSKGCNLLKVEVRQRLNCHTEAEVELRQTEDIRFPFEQCLGKDLKITAFDDSGQSSKVFDGMVLKSSLDYEISGGYKAKISGVTRSYKLSVTPQEAYFKDKTLQDVAPALAGEDGLTAAINVPARPLKNYVQWGESDFDFLLRIIDDYRAWLRPTDDGFEVYSSFQPGSTLAWRTEDGLLSFRLEGALSPASFNGTMYDPTTTESHPFDRIKQAPQFTGSAGPLVSAVQSESGAKLANGYYFLDARAPTPSEYEARLKQESVRSIGAQILGHGVSRNALLKPGDAVTISGTLDAQGEYGLIAVTHKWNGRGYLNEFECTPWKDFIEPQRPERKPIHGVISAQVVEHNDPLKMGRIKIQYDWQQEGETGWARMVTPHAGHDRGWMFMPEVGDEVLVAFEHGDAERPIIMGCLWNGVDHAPREEFWGGDVEPNDVKRIVTKSGHRIQLSDKQGKESIVIATPKHLKISLIEETDETGRSMITLYSSNGDMFFSAPNGRIHFRSRYFSREVG